MIFRGLSLKIHLTFAIVIVCLLQIYSQSALISIPIKNTLTNVQPMTGIVLWNDSNHNNTDAISLEYSYMLYNSVVTGKGVYDWTAVENVLDDIASRKHQAILRFRFVYPGYETSVPGYIKLLGDYKETIGQSEGKNTHFPDWTNEELKRFTLEFYTKFAKRYDSDPRLAFIQTGFGLWAEYHIYDGPFTLGKTFPGKDFQESFLKHLDSTLNKTPWSISVDAADNTYSPFEAIPDLKDISFGLFDDSFMHKEHEKENEPNWNFFDRNRYKTSPAGGEFSYYSNFDQKHVLDLPTGAHGKSFETFAQKFHVSYMIGNDQPDYQNISRIKEAGLACGYRFKIVSIMTAIDTSVIEIKNVGVSPIYYDAYISVNKVRAEESLKLLAPGGSITYYVSEQATNDNITIECDRLVAGQKIGFIGTEVIPPLLTLNYSANSSLIYPNPVTRGEDIYLASNAEFPILSYSIYTMEGKPVINNIFSNTNSINTTALNYGIYFVKINSRNSVKSCLLIVNGD